MGANLAGLALTLTLAGLTLAGSALTLTLADATLCLQMRPRAAGSSSGKQDR